MAKGQAQPNLDLDQRVRLPDGRAGFVLSIVHPGRGAESVEVMTDSYVRVTCRRDQIQVVERKKGGLVPVDEMNKHKVYPIERENHERLRRAIWHQHWDRYGNVETFPDTGTYGEYARLYKEGKREPMPGKEDIRSLTASQARQLTLF